MGILNGDFEDEGRKDTFMEKTVTDYAIVNGKPWHHIKMYQLKNAQDRINQQKYNRNK